MAGSLQHLADGVVAVDAEGRRRALGLLRDTEIGDAGMHPPGGAQCGEHRVWRVPARPDRLVELLEYGRGVGPPVVSVERRHGSPVHSHAVRMSMYRSPGMPRRRAEGVATRAEQATATREALIDTARRLWADKGFFATSMTEIVEAAGAGTRGALYHHFADREELFLAVFDAVQEELTTSLTPTKIDSVDPITRVRNVLLVFLDLVAERPDAQALLIDGPAVFGWRRWRALSPNAVSPPSRTCSKRPFTPTRLLRTSSSRWPRCCSG